MGQHKPEAYEWIAKWGNMMGSFPLYIQEQQHRAAKDGAPLTAIFKRDDAWATIDQVSNADTRRVLGLPQLPQPEVLTLEERLARTLSLVDAHLKDGAVIEDFHFEIIPGKFSRDQYGSITSVEGWSLRLVRDDYYQETEYPGPERQLYVTGDSRKDNYGITQEKSLDEDGNAKTVDVASASLYRMIGGGSR